MKTFVSLCSVAVLPCVGEAAVLNSVPMQGGMVMPMISYRAAENRLAVMVDPAVPQLTPLLVSNPADAFNPADPWFDLLDPSRLGYSFSRRYGFVMDTMTDPLPLTLQIWIRKISGDPQVLAYRYATSTPKVFEPIFGTSGSPSALRWNGMMFHPVFAAPPAASTFTATFEAYLVEAATGAQVPNSSTGPFALNWTNVPDGRPTLAASKNEAGQLVLSWSAEHPGCQLQSVPSVPGSAWTPVTNAPVLAGQTVTVTVAPGPGQQFFRLQAP